ncbi:GTPase ObgE [Spiroplasma endosymbiont of Polydrusus pterygomalis]|uniref:GTPase ObgE n=1 Tax=Spiroplasma endosymbiont of Polydrusus pterygomalis TaxID=3139327 RepID=UPI003CCA8630
MKFIDVATIKLFAGKGGDGAVAFHRELYVPKGGPSGGDGGDGGSIIFVGDEGMNTLLDLKYQREIKAADGENGTIKNMHGKNASNKYIRVPLGTLIYNNQTNEIIADTTTNQQEHVLAKGGQGGRGNARFANAKNKASTIFEAGDLGETVEIRCELKVLADVGLVGLPNVGKSTLLAKISKAKPQIDDYPFTTLTPQLGAVRDQNQNTFVVADLPGLIAGAAAGKGLGHDFLRHIERCKLIVHVLDMSGNYGIEDVYQNYLSVKTELKNYNYKLELRPEIIVANKMDLEIATENLVKFKAQMPDAKIIGVSGLMQQNLSLLVNEIGTMLTKIKDNKALWQLDELLVEAEDYKVYTYNNLLETEVEVVNLGNEIWKVSGDAVYKAYHKTPITTYDNLLLFNKKLQDLKVFEILRAKGAKAGDTVRIFDYELEWDG